MRSGRVQWGGFRDRSTRWRVFYAFVKVGGDDVGVARDWLNSAHVAVTPGTAFCAPGWLRLSYAASMERLEEALERIRSVI